MTSGTICCTCGSDGEWAKKKGVNDGIETYMVYEILLDERSDDGTLADTL